jgi:hypothetical protein
MIRASLKYTRQNAVAFLALFVALSGTAFAATSLPKNSVGNKQIKKSAVTGVKVKKNTLTGTQINESKLKRVPDASKLGGLLPSAFLPAGGTAVNADKLDGIDSAVFGTAITVPGTAFELRDTVGAGEKVSQGTGAISEQGATEDFQYTVHLPQGARVTRLDYRYIDNEGAVNNSLKLIAFNSMGDNSSASETLATAVTVGSSAGQRTASATPTEPVTIDNTKWAYVLSWEPFFAGPTIQLVGARVNYVVPTG